MKTGQCKFGITCKFHHPQPAGTTVPPPPASAPQFYPSVQSLMPDQYGGPSSSLRVARTLLPGSYMQGAYGPMLLTPGVVPIPGWSPYSVTFFFIDVSSIHLLFTTVSYCLTFAFASGTCEPCSISWCAARCWGNFFIWSYTAHFHHSFASRGLSISVLSYRCYTERTGLSRETW